MNDAISCVALILSLGGNLLIAYKLKVGFWVWITSNVLWIIVNLLSADTNWYQIAMYAVYIGMNLFSIIKWSNNKKEE